MVVAVVLINYFTNQNWFFWNYISTTVIGCQDVQSTVVWTKTFPKMSSSSNVKLKNISKDGVSDLIFGFGTGNYSKFILFF